MKVLIVQIARIGDLIMTSTLVSALKDKHGEDKIKIDMLVSKPFAETAAGIPGIDKIWTISLSEIIKPISGTPSVLLESYGVLRNLCRKLRQERFDFVLNLTHTDYSAYLTKLIEGKKSQGIILDGDGRKVVRGGWAKYYFNAFINRKLNPFHVVDIHLKMAGVKLPQKLNYTVNAEIQQQADGILSDVNPHNHPVVAIIPGASTPEKMWGADNFSEALQLINAEENITAIVFGSAGDLPMAEQIVAKFSAAVNVAGKTSVELLAAILKRCDLTLTNDTGPMHLAAAVGSKTIDISLGSAYAAETAPYAEGHFVVEPTINCYPCNACHVCKHHECHSCVSPELVARLAIAVLKGENPDVRRIQNARCRISKTGFDENGYWKLIPLRQEDVRYNTDILGAYRKIWNDTLDQSTNRKSLGIYDLSVLWEHSEDIEGETAELQIARKIGGIESMMELLQIGENAAKMMGRLTELDANMDSISRLSLILGEVDRAIVGKAFQHTLLMPLVSQFTLEKDAIKGDSLKTLSRNTVVLYRDFASRLQSIDMLRDVYTPAYRKIQTSEVVV